MSDIMNLYKKIEESALKFKERCDSNPDLQKFINSLKEKPVNETTKDTEDK